MRPFTQPAWLEPRTAYLHVPFCGHHCGYCDFAVTAGQDHLIELYLDALELELATLGQPVPVETLFLGGGTPTYLSAEQLQRLFRSLNHWVRKTSPTGECSIESTPESLTADKLDVLVASGVTRVSIGVQSFQTSLLTALDRRHGVEQIARAVELVQGRGLELSFDLIFAAPGQTQEQWTTDLGQALAYQPDHVSTYGLTYETGTPLWKARERGQVRTVTEDDELAYYLAGIESLTAAGFEHYEVSNFARPGRRSRHNERYWANEAYWGFGVGAARYVQGIRETNIRNTTQYIRKVLAGESPTQQTEELPPRERAFETLATQLRRLAGIDRLRFHDQTGFDLETLIGDRLSTLIAEGLLQDTGPSVALTRRGLCVADGIIAELMKAM